MENTAQREPIYVPYIVVTGLAPVMPPSLPLSCRPPCPCHAALLAPVMPPSLPLSCYPCSLPCQVSPYGGKHSQARPHTRSVYSSDRACPCHVLSHLPCFSFPDPADRLHHVEHSHHISYLSCKSIDRRCIIYKTTHIGMRKGRKMAAHIYDSDRSTRFTRRSLRLKTHNYAWTGTYFVTIRAREHEPLFEIPELRTILADTWHALPQRFPGL